MDLLPSVHGMPYLIISALVSYGVLLFLSILALMGLVSLTIWAHMSIFLSLPIMYFISVLIYIGY